MPTSSDVDDGGTANPSDTGPADAGTPDVGTPDAGTPDAGNALDVSLDTGRDVLGDVSPGRPDVTTLDAGRDASTDVQPTSDAGCRADPDCGAGRLCVAGACVQRGGGAFFPPPPAGFATTPAQSVEGCVEPIGLAFAADGTLYASCIRGGRVVRVNPSTGALTDVATGNAYVADSRFGRRPAADIRVSPTGVRTEVITGLSWPHDLAFDARGNLWVADYGSNRVLRFNAR